MRVALSIFSAVLSLRHTRSVVRLDRRYSKSYWLPFVCPLELGSLTILLLITGVLVSEVLTFTIVGSLGLDDFWGTHVYCR